MVADIDVEGRAQRIRACRVWSCELVVAVAMILLLEVVQLAGAWTPPAARAVRTSPIPSLRASPPSPGPVIRGAEPARHTVARAEGAQARTTDPW